MMLAHLMKIGPDGAFGSPTLAIRQKSWTGSEARMATVKQS